MNFRKEFFVYATKFSSITASSEQTKNLAIDTDAPFECIKMTRAFVNDVANPTLDDYALGQNSPNFRVSIFDNGIGKFITDKPVEIVNMFGTAQFPFVLTEPLVFKAGGSLTITIYNDNTVFFPNTLMLSFIGRKLFRN